jgi:hypothetical protein
MCGRVLSTVRRPNCRTRYATTKTMFVPGRHRVLAHARRTIRSPGFGRWTTPRAVPGIIDAVVTQPYQDCRLAGAYQPGNEMPASSLQSWVGLITSFAPTGPSRVLDVGAGTGMFAARVRRIRRGREE